MKKMCGMTIPGILFAIMGILFLTPALDMGFIDTLEEQPGAGFFPVLLSICLIFIGVLMAISGLLSNGRERYFILTEEIKNNLKTFFAVLIGLAILLIIWKVWRFEAAVLIFCFCMNLYLKRGIPFAILFTAFFSLMLYCIFILGLKIQFNL